MAIYHFHGKAVCRSKGHSAVAAAAYRAGEKLFDDTARPFPGLPPALTACMAPPEASAVAAAAYRAGDKLFDARQDRVYDYSPRSRVVTSFILAPPQASAWMAERETLWNACEAIERRKDSCVARELEVALPRELSLDASIALVTGFVREQLTPRGVVADVAIHQGPARDGGTNPHAHILFTPRPVLKDGSGFGKKDRGLERRETLGAVAAGLARPRQPRPGRRRARPPASITAPWRSRAARARPIPTLGRQRAGDGTARPGHPARGATGAPTPTPPAC